MVGTLKTLYTEEGIEQKAFNPAAFSLTCILAVVLFNVLATRKTVVSCCDSPAGDCH